MPRRRVPRPLTGARNAANRIYAILARVEAIEAKLAETSGRIDQLSAQLEGLSRLAQLGEETLHTLERHRNETLEILLLLRDDEPGTRRLLWQMREAPDYEAAYDEAEPLVSMVIPTFTNTRQLLEIALPSLVAQTYERWEAIVVGDAVGPEVEAAVRGFGDKRIQYANVTHRGPYPEDRHLLWRVAGGPPANEGLRLARGHWIGQMDDDDTCTPDHIELLLKAARDRRLEFCYGRVRQHHPDGSVQVLGQFPPGAHGVSMTCSLGHAGLRFIASELGDHLFGMTGDWVRVRRMMRIGVRIGMIDDVVLDYYPAQLWKPEAGPVDVGNR